MNWQAEYEKAKHLRSRLRNGGVVGALLSLSDPSVAEIFATAGYDFVIIDEEHSAHSLETIQAMLQACTGTDTTAFVRPVSLDHDRIRRFLDLGCFGIVCPHIESPEQAEVLVRACRYPPLGSRSFGPIRASGYFSAIDDYVTAANEAVVVMPMIESAAGVSAAMQIASVRGVDAICIGPSDLSISLGERGNLDSPAYKEAMSAIRAACTGHGVALGAGAYSPEHARMQLAEGMNFTIAASDETVLLSGAEAARRFARDE